MGLTPWGEKAVEVWAGGVYSRVKRGYEIPDFFAFFTVSTVAAIFTFVTVGGGFGEFCFWGAVQGADDR